jgi:hypothetical protein
LAAAIAAWIDRRFVPKAAIGNGLGKTNRSERWQQQGQKEMKVDLELPQPDGEFREVSVHIREFRSIYGFESHGSSVPHEES